MDQISPELAAAIVKNYVLPMFESKQKKQLKTKYNKMTSISKATGKKFTTTSNFNSIPKAEDFSMSGKGQAPMGTVYGELKLSEKLSNELNIIRFEVDKLNEMLEDASYQRDQYKRELEHIKLVLLDKDKEINNLKKQAKEMREANNSTIIKCEQMIKSSYALTEFVSTSENYRKKFSEQLREVLQENDDHSNKIFELKQNKRLTEISYELVQVKLNMMFESINEISNAKNLEDKYRLKITQQEDKIDKLLDEKFDLETQLKTIMKERDTFRDELKDICDLKIKLEREKAAAMLNNKEIMSNLNQKIYKL